MSELVLQERMGETDKGGSTQRRSRQSSKENAHDHCVSDASRPTPQTHVIGVYTSERQAPRLRGRPKAAAATDDADCGPMHALVERAFHSQPVDIDKVDKFWDEYLCCEQCETFYDTMCAKHPLITIHAMKLPPRLENRAELSVLPFLRIGESGKERAGRGVFATMLLPAGIVFGPYCGIRGRSAKSAARSGYAWRIDLAAQGPNGRQRCCYVDAADPDASCWMRFVNCATDDSEQNLMSYQYRGGIYYKLHRPVHADEELLVWYGQSYGEELGIKVADTTRRRIRRKRLPYSNPFIVD